MRLWGDSPSVLPPVPSDWVCFSLHQCFLIALKSHSLITEYWQTPGEQRGIVQQQQTVCKDSSVQGKCLAASSLTWEHFLFCNWVCLFGLLLHLFYPVLWLQWITVRGSPGLLGGHLVPSWCRAPGPKLLWLREQCFSDLWLLLIVPQTLIRAVFLVPGHVAWLC